MQNIFTRPVRKWVYGVTIALIPVLVYAGVMEPAGAALIAPLALALLNLTPEDTTE